MNTAPNINATTGQLEQMLQQALSRVGPGMDMGPMGGFGTGFAPTIGGMNQMQQELMRNQAMMRQMAMNDVRARSMAQMTSQFIGGPDAQPSGFQTQMWGTLINQPGVAGLFGGSMMDMTLGAQNVLRGGARIDGNQVFANQALGQQMTMGLVDQMQSHFFTERGGQRRTRTAGFDRTELGQIMSFMGTRGAFAGLEVGEMQGGELQVRPEAMRELGQRTEDAAEMFRELKNLMGSRPIQELAQVAEDLAGHRIGIPGGVQGVTQRLRQAQQQNAASGVPTMTILEMQQQAGTLAQRLGFSGGAGMQIGMHAIGGTLHQQQANMAAQNQAAAENRFVAVPELAQLQAEGVRATTSMLGLHDMGGMSMAALMLQTGQHELHGVDSGRMRQLLRQGDPGAMQRELGVDLRELTFRAGGVENVMNQLNPHGEGMQAMMEGRRRQEVGRRRNAVRRLALERGMGSEAADIMEFTHGVMGREAREQLITAMDDGADVDTLTSILDTGFVDSDRAQALAARLGGLSPEGQERAAIRMRDLQAQMGARGGIFLRPTEADTRRARERELAAVRFDESAPAGPTGFLQQVAGRILGDRTVTDQAVLRFMEDEDSAVRMGKGEQITERDIRRLESLGVTGHELTAGMDRHRLTEVLAREEDAGNLMVRRLIDEEGGSTRGFIAGDAESAGFLRRNIESLAPQLAVAKLVAKATGEIPTGVFDLRLHAEEMMEFLSDKDPKKWEKLGLGHLTDEDREAWLSDWLSETKEISGRLLKENIPEITTALMEGDEDFIEAFDEAGGRGLLQRKRRRLKRRKSGIGLQLDAVKELQGLDDDDERKKQLIRRLNLEEDASTSEESLQKLQKAFKEDKQDTLATMEEINRALGVTSGKDEDGGFDGTLQLEIVGADNLVAYVSRALKTREEGD